ncbi:NAD(P)/FAD-dependent oxidoreductase [Leucobacter tardus]|uniref:FAD-dependent monooxygenase n=1 Tax=Leucobacter tardus TaxID=501483 RepID=A0A939QF23_9MICO|nr:NAD(P)/FAD-dependent oxidoreductase [Leucobacter tardus]MBO2989680.1 FAD-dependent monooxygenase [Leucobacter tardus]
MIDLIVIGAGPVGLACALEAARLGATARVLDAAVGPGASSRAVGVHPSALLALAPSGAGDAIAAEARQVRRGEARGRGRVLGAVRFARLGGAYPFVATVPQQRTEAVLADRIAALGGSEVVWNAEVRAVRTADDRCAVDVHDAAGGLREEYARFVVVATGARGADLTGLRAAARRHEYPDRYLMADVPDRGADGDTAVIHLHPEGVLESFPLPGGRRRFVAWDRGVPRTASGAADDGARLGERLRHAVALRTGSPAAASAIGAATGFGVRRVLVPRMCRGRVAVIGDAAHEVSPIGGQGMNLGILDAVTLARALCGPERRLTDAVAHLDDALDRWDRRRRRAAVVSGRLAAANTRVGRARGEWGDRARSAVLSGTLHSPAERLLASAYTMRFDPDGRLRG